MLLKYGFKNNWLTGKLYVRLKKLRDERRYAFKFKYHGEFIDRQHGDEKLCIMLAGYKEFLYPVVFSRLKRFLPEDIDMCVVSSGLQSNKLEEICRENNWSYLYTKENNVSLIQNVAIKLHPSAKYIYKLDEDIFVTENYFENMIRAYKHAQKGIYNPGVIAPIIPVNGYGHVRILDKLNLMNCYVDKFGEVKVAAGASRPIEGNPEVSKFFWGNSHEIWPIDEMNRVFGNEKLEERPCPIRFSIGAILFERELWESMGAFNVNCKGSSMGKDETELCTFCLLQSRPLMVTENVVVGHLSFGKQNEVMREYFEKNKGVFILRK